MFEKYLSKNIKIYSFSFPNLKGRSNEDFYLVSKKYPIFTIADGVSRVQNRDGSYPKPSGARLSAEEFCKTTISYLEKNFKIANLKTLRESFNFANKAIFNLNEKYGINKKLDYLVSDYFSTCGVAAFIKDNIFYFGYVGDCGIRIYDKNDFLKFISIDDVAVLEGWRDNQKFKSEKERLLIWRKILRNKPDAPYLTYGVFTGEKKVENYYHLGKIKLQKGDAIFLFSDGALYFIKKPKFRYLPRTYQKNKFLKEANQFIKREMKARKITEENSEILFDDKTLISFLI